MRCCNETALEGQDLHFYGMDMQRFDHNKFYLFEVLNEADTCLSQEYKARFAELTDDSRLKFASNTLEQAKTDAKSLTEAMQAYSKTIIAAVRERFQVNIISGQL